MVQNFTTLADGPRTAQFEREIAVDRRTTRPDGRSPVERDISPGNP